MPLMIVCICNAITEEKVRLAARAGAPCARSAYANLGCEVECGSCLDYAREIIEEERADLLKIGAEAA